MSGIISRTIFFDRKRGYVRPHDHALVQTGLGAMVEPNFPFQRTNVGGTLAGFSSYDSTDQISRVDNIQEASLDVIGRLLFGETQTIHGGMHMPRSG